MSGTRQGTFKRVASHCFYSFSYQQHLAVCVHKYWWDSYRVSKITFHKITPKPQNSIVGIKSGFLFIEMRKEKRIKLSLSYKVFILNCFHMIILSAKDPKLSNHSNYLS